MACSCGTVNPANHARWCSDYRREVGSATERTVVPSTPAVSPTGSTPVVEASPHAATGEFSAPMLLNAVEMLRNVKSLDEAYDQLGHVVRMAQALRQGVATKMWETSMASRPQIRRGGPAPRNIYEGSLLDEF